ncbi:MAG: hypothetical protein R6X20_14610 [Phycisphaerae bacterium]
MLQFGELLTLGLCTVTAVYLVLHRRQIGDVPGLRPLVFPFLLVALAFLATVVEGIPAGGDVTQIIFWERSPQAVERGGWLGALLNLLEHAAYLGAAVALAVFVWRQRKRRGATPP